MKGMPTNHDRLCFNLKFLFAETLDPVLVLLLRLEICSPYICCGSVLSLIQFFIFLCFVLIIMHYHTQKQRKIKIEPRIKLNHNIYTPLSNVEPPARRF